MSRLNPAIQAALKDPKNGSVYAIYARKRKTGSPFKTHDSRVRYTVSGESAIEVAAKNGITKTRFYQRLRAGWPVEQAATNKGRTRYDSDSRTNISVSGVVD